MTQSQSISFDRAAGFYDQTRGFPAGMSELVAATAIDLLGAKTNVLEIGVGTGRIAKPLLAAGVQVTGIDLSRDMMNRLRETLVDLPAPALLEGDITRLPFADGAFDAVVGVHILHLVSGWEGALDEALRVTKVGGLFLMGHDHHLPNAIQELRIFLRENLEKQGIQLRRSGREELEDEVENNLRERGAIVTIQKTPNWSRYITLAEDIEGIEQKLWSHLWAVPDDALAKSVKALRQYALTRFGSLDLRIETQHTFVWRAFQWNDPDKVMRSSRS